MTTANPTNGGSGRQINAELIETLTYFEVCPLGARLSSKTVLAGGGESH